MEKKELILNMCKKRLLILSCSARKTEVDIAPAILRYQSPVFFLVRRWLRLNPQNNLVIWILSAKYGLMGKAHKTEHYDLVLTTERAQEISQKINRQFIELSRKDFNGMAPESVFCHLPENYRNALESQIKVLKGISDVHIAISRPREQAKMLKEWLER